MGSNPNNGKAMKSPTLRKVAAMAMMAGALGMEHMPDQSAYAPPRTIKRVQLTKKQLKARKKAKAAKKARRRGR